MNRSVARAVVWSLVLLVAVSLRALADEPATAPAPLPAFRRIFIPADEVEQQNWTGRYLPVVAEEFEEHLQTVYDGARGAPDARGARLEQADYVAQVVEGDLLVGSAQLRLASRPGSAALLGLDPCGIAVTSARWIKPDAPALVGAGPAGHVQVLVEGTDLELEWSQRGERTASGSVTFQLALPACPMTRIVLDAPAGQQIMADRGIVTRDTGVAGANRWSIELGGHDRVTLRVVPEDNGRRSLTLLRQSLSYEFSPRGVNVAAQLRLDVHGEPLERATIALDPSLHLVSARYGKQAVPWSATTDGETGQQLVLLEFPELVSGMGRVLQLSAVAPLVIGQRVTLPGMRPRQLAWQEGTAELLIGGGLVLEQLETSGCRQSRVAVLPAPLDGESIEIQYFEPGATIEVLVAEPKERLPLSAGTLVEIGDDEVTSRCAFEIDFPQEGRRHVRIPIRTDWTIDTVERLQAEGPLDWDIEELRSGAPELVVELNEPGRVLVRGHRSTPAEPACEAAQLQMLDFADFDAQARLISVRAAEGWELHWSGIDELRRRDATSLEPAELQLFSQLPDGLVFVEDETFAQSSLTRARRQPNYSVDIHIDAAVQDRILQETYTIQCVPDAARVERLLVHFSQAREETLEWSLAGGNSGEFSARRLSAAEQTKARMPQGGEVWELLLRLERAGAFELRAQRVLPFEMETPLALVSVGDATTQRGTLAIRALGETGLEINNRRLISVPAELLDPDHYQTARATYHYQPSGDDLAAQPALSIAPAEVQQAETGAWAWTGDLQSRFATDGTCVHQATFRIQTAGRRQLQLGLPAGAKLLSIWVDDRRLPPLSAGSSDTRPLVDLPSGRSRATLTVYYATEATLPALERREAPPLVTLDDISVLLRKWTLWLPPGFEVTDVAGAASEGLSPPTWSERLFGPLGRGPSQRLFNPLVAADWSATFAGPAESQRVERDAEQAVRNLGVQWGSSLNDEELTWGQVLSAASETEATLGQVLLVNAERLAEIGVTPQSRVGPPVPGDSPLERGIRLLRDTGLVAIAAPRCVLLTAADDAATYRQELRAPRQGLIYTAVGGPLVDSMQTAAAAQGWSRFETVGQWRAGLAYQPANWTWPRPMPLAACDPRGWSSYTLQLSELGSPRVRIVRSDSMRSLAWAMFLGLVGVGLWKPLAKPAALVALVASAAALALVLPAAYASLASAALLAGLFCLAARMTRSEAPRVFPRDRSTASHKAPSNTIRQVTTAVLLAVLASAAAGAGAAPPNEAGPIDGVGQTDAPQYEVFVPVDKEQQPTGGKFYVPAEMYLDLVRRSAAISGRPKDWIVTRATYRGALSRDTITARLELAELTARFDLRVFQSNVPVQLPLARASWGRVISTARLDGRAIPVAWTNAGDGLMLGPLAPGSYRLELELRAAVPSGAAQASFDLPIPKLPQATLEMSLPQDGVTIDVPGARGQVVVDKTRGQLVAALGGSDRLAARWPTGIGADAAPTNLEVEELIWLKVRPGTTVIDARFKFHVLAGRVRQLRLLTDPRLSLLSSPDAQQVTVHTIPGDPQRIELELAQDVSDEIVVDLSFLVTGTSGVGYLRLPRLESAGTTASRRWLGVSVDPALQPNIQTGEDSRSLDISEFVAAWGAADENPRAAFSISRGEPVWVLSTQPSEPRTSVAQTLAASLGRRSTLLRYEAEVTIERGVLVQLELEAPPGIVVERVSMLEDDVQRVARWSVDRDGQISVFLNAPIDGRQKLSLAGRWNPPDLAAFVAPHVRVLSADVRKDELHLYRQPAVLAALEKRPGARQLETSEIELEDGFGSLAAGYALESAEASVRVKLSSNNPRLQAVAATYLDRDGDRWMAELDYHVEVSGGLADTLRFEIPPQWSQPFRVDPAMRYDVVSIPGEQRRELVLYPNEPFAGKRQIRVRGRVAPLPGDRLSVPDVVPLRTSQLERFVVLPRQLELQQVTWDWLGLVPDELPGELAPHRAEASPADVYKVAGEHFQASLKAVKRASAVAQVELVDIQLVWQAGGSFQAVAAFDLEPGGSTQCVLELPDGSHLVHASVEQLPALVAPLSKNRWRLGLGPQQLPQRIEVVYAGSYGGSARLKRFEAPRLVGMKVAQVLWTVYGLPSDGPAVASQSNWQIGPDEQHLKRLATVAGLVELPAEVVGEHLPEEIARWYAAWRKRYSAARTALRGELVAGSRRRARPSDTPTASQLDERIRAVDQRLAATRATSQGVPLNDALIQLASLAREDLLPTHFATAADSYGLELRYPRAAGSGLLGRILAALAIVALGAGVAWYLRGRPLPTFAPWAVACTAGLAWWLLLAPSSLGLLAVCVTAGMALWSHWQSDRRRLFV